MKEIVTTRRTTGVILAMVMYQATFALLMFADTPLPYDAPSTRRKLYYFCSFSAPSCICFVVVLVSTSVLVVRLKRNMEWRNEATKQSTSESGSTKERKAARSVIAVCTIFIICFLPNVAVLVISIAYPKFDIRDPYLGNLARVVFIFSFLFQVVNSTVNIFVYYNMSTKYREVFNALLCKKTN